MTYMVEGQQYLVVAVSGAGYSGELPSVPPSAGNDPASCIRIEVPSFCSRETS